MTFPTPEEIERAIRAAEDAREFAEDLANDLAGEIAFGFPFRTYSYLVNERTVYENLWHINIPISDQFIILF